VVPILSNCDAIPWISKLSDKITERTHVNDKRHKVEEKEHSSDVSSCYISCLVRRLMHIVFHHIHKPQGSLNAVLKSRERTCGWVGPDNGMQVSFLFCCWIVLDRDIWVVCDAQRAMPSAVFFIRLFLSLPLLTFLLPFRCHSRSLLPTGPASIISCRAAADYILYEAKLEFALVTTKS